MNLKAFFKGLGAGIIGASAILIIISKLNNGSISDEQVIKRAKELGMVESSTLSSSSGISGQETSADNPAGNDTEDNIDDTVDNSESDASTDNGNVSEVGNDTDQNITDTADNSDTDADASTDNGNDTEDGNDDTSSATDTADNSDNVPKPSGETVKVEIRSGMSSESAASAAMEAGLVDDDKEFNKYLCANGYDKRLRVGSYDIPKGSDFETISKYLCGLMND